MLTGVLPAGRYPRALLLIVLFITLPTGTTAPFLFVYLDHVRRLDPTTIGLVGATIGGVGLCLAVAVGPLLDRLGPRTVIGLMAVPWALGPLLLAVTHSAWQAFVAAALIGVAGAPAQGAFNALVATATDPAERQRFFGLVFAVLNLGIGLGSLIGAAVVDVARPQTFELLYVVSGLTLLVAGLVTAALRPPTIASAEPGEPASGASRGYRSVLADRVFRRYLAIVLLLVSVTWAQQEFGLTAFSVEVAHVSTRVLGWAFAANSLVIVVAQVSVLRRIDGRSRSRILALVGLVVATAWLVLAAGTWLRGWSAGAVATAVVLSAVGVAVGEVLMSPVLPSLTNALASDSLRGRYNALYSTTTGSTSIIGPLTAAPLIGHGLGGLWIGLVICGSLVVSVLALRLRPRLSAEQDGTAPTTATPTSTGGADGAGPMPEAGEPESVIGPAV